MSAQPAPHLRLVNTETGEFVPSQKLEELMAELAKVRGDFKNAERDLKIKRRQLTELQRDKARERLEHPQHELIERICKYWHRRCRHGDVKVNPMSPARFDAVAGLVEMEMLVAVEGKRRRRREWRYEMEDFKAAIDGADFDHYAKKRKNGTEQHFDDLELICRDSKQFEEFRARCPHPVVPILPARPRPGMRGAIEAAAGPAHRVGLGVAPSRFAGAGSPA